MRLISIDFGTKRTGIALGESRTSDPGSGLALPFEMFENLTDAQLAQAIADLARREAVDQIVVGLPLNADGSVSQQTKRTEQFISVLQGKTVTPIVRYSEYLSSHDAESKLAGHYTRMQKRQRVDALAAARILQDFIDGLPRE